MSLRCVPITEKQFNFTNNKGIVSISCCMQGLRKKKLEDSYSINELPSGILMYSVYDENDGNEISNFTSKYLPEIFKHLESGFTEDEIKNGFIELNNRLLIHEITKELVCETSGSKLSVVFIDNNRIVTAILGDCHAIISRKNRDIICFQECIHELKNQKEYNFIPNIIIKNRCTDDNFLIIGSGGIFEVLSYQTIVNKIQTYINNGVTIKNTLENILDECLFPSNSSELLGKNNITIIFINLDNKNNAEGITTEYLIEYEKYRFNECHGGC